ncbi:Reticulon-like protein B8 [Dichanthelium oligosanthes]|uniref:Reticulon-like protein n=1 Tax=Dichanthelium oligosanthes TaxID=888268 RepID=A0A1E5WME8_9POAL|nr:Reticulon-like protein B8 [Dichanthelium oligosanthes]
MAENSENAAGKLMNNIMETIAENLPDKKSVRFDDGEGSISDQAKKLFGGGGGQGKKSVHHVLGGGKSADVLLWRNKKISSSVLGVATLVWIILEWLDYHFLTIVSFVLVLGMAVQFAWATFAGMLNRSPSNVPRVELPEELFETVGKAAGAQVNKVLGMLQDISCGRDLKRFLIVIGALFAAAIIGSWCNFLTVIYIGFMSAHTLPVLYEKYQDQVDDFLYSMLGLLQNQYQKLDKSVLSRVPKGSAKSRKSD